MKLKDIKEPLLVLLEDAGVAEEYLEHHDSQFSRRAYIRSIFAYIEGTVWNLKQVCLNAKPAKGIRKMTPSEYTLLTEKTYELKNNGEPKAQSKFLRLPENIRFTFNLLNKLFKGNVSLGVGTENWDQFLQALDMRHRITHPKSSSEFQISNEEIEVCKSVFSWFNQLVNDCFQLWVSDSIADNSNI